MYNFEDENNESTTTEKLSSYSDLFAIISFVMMLLYVVSTIKNTVMNVSSMQEKMSIKQESQEKVDIIMKSTNKIMAKLARTYDTDLNAIAKDFSNEKINIEVEQAELLKKLKELELRAKKINALETKFKVVKVENQKLEKERDFLAKQKVKEEKKVKWLERSIASVETQNEELQNKVKVQDSKYRKEIRQIVTKEKRKRKDLKNFYKNRISTIKTKKKEAIKWINERNQKRLLKERAKTQSIAKAEERRVKKLMAKKYNAKLKIIKNKYGEIPSIIKKYKNNIDQEKLVYVEKVSNLETKLDTISKEKKDLEESATKVAQRKKLLKKFSTDLKEVLGKEGIAYTANKDNTEIDIPFEEVNFLFNSAKLQKSMKKSLDKFFPIYAKTLFSNPEISKQIKSIEIIGYASPTFNGKYVDPKKISKKNQKAVQYNMDLSYARARSIFTYIYRISDKANDGQKSLLRHLKLSGRSYLEDQKSNYRGLSSKEYCAKYNCYQKQKARLKLNLK